MTVGKISQHFNESQKASCLSALNSVKDLHKSHDNSCTYAMTGLLRHLLEAIVNDGVFASSYVREKVELLEGCVAR